MTVFCNLSILSCDFTYFKYILLIISDIVGSLNNGDIRDSSSCFLMDRKYSEPILSQNEGIEENAIIRSNEIENIPEHIRETPEPTSPHKHR